MEIRPLDDAGREALNDGLQLAARLTGSDLPLGLDQVQALYDALLRGQSDYSNGIIAAGLAFGELIAEKLDVEWVRISDEYGEETSLAVPGKKISCHPISMIQKRLEDGEAVEIGGLRDNTIEHLQDIIERGVYDMR